MADIDRMFRSELAVLAEQPTDADLWTLDPRPSSQFASVFAPFDIFDADHTSILSPPSPRISESGRCPDTALGLFPAPDRRLGGTVPPIQQADRFHIPFTPHLHHPQPTVHPSDLSLGTAPVSLPTLMPVPPTPSVQIPMSVSSSSGTRLTDSPTDSRVLSDFSLDDMDSDYFELASPSDSEFLPALVSVDPATLSAESMDPHAMAPIRPSRRPSRAIANIPVPIPNFTKKSRGRKVPTSNGEPIFAASRDKTKRGLRAYTCPADGCGKCFVRGEHLKRHIRSIHTDEKPWTCTHENCSRTFSRQDNLNQHLRIHKLQDDDD